MVNLFDFVFPGFTGIWIPIILSIIVVGVMFLHSKIKLFDEIQFNRSMVIVLALIWFLWYLLGLTNNLVNALLEVPLIIWFAIIVLGFAIYWRFFRK